MEMAVPEGIQPNSDSSDETKPERLTRLPSRLTHEKRGAVAGPAR